MKNKAFVYPDVYLPDDVDVKKVIELLSTVTFVILDDLFDDKSVSTHVKEVELKEETTACSARHERRRRRKDPR